MQKQNGQTTSQVSGITSIPPQSIRRYIKDFGSFFSQDARKPTKGRRFTSQDINNLLLIRHLRYSHKSDADINKALSEGSQVETLYRNLDALAMIEAMDQRIKSISSYEQEVKLSMVQVNNIISRANKIIDQLISTIKSCEQVPGFIDQVRDLRIQVEELKAIKQVQPPSLLEKLFCKQT